MDGATLDKADEPKERDERLTKAVSEAAGVVSRLYAGHILFAAYLGVSFWSTTHEQLLRGSLLKLPVLDVELPMGPFYVVGPALLVVLHVVLPVNLYLLSRPIHGLLAPSQLLPAPKPM